MGVGFFLVATLLVVLAHFKSWINTCVKRKEMAPDRMHDVIEKACGISDLCLIKAPSREEAKYLGEGYCPDGKIIRITVSEKRQGICDRRIWCCSWERCTSTDFSEASGMFRLDARFKMIGNGTGG